jgi:hypothetical protein
MLLAFARPYKQSSDFYLALMSNSALVCCFGLGLILYHCNEDNEDSCQEFVGMGLDSYSTTLVVVMMTIFVVLITLLSLVMIIAINIIKKPKMRVSNEAPNLELDGKFKYHAFLSYATSDHKSASMISSCLKNYLPTMKIYCGGAINDALEK